MKHSGFSKVLIIILAAAVIIAATILIYRFTRPQASVIREEAIASDRLIGGQTDESGCLIAAGYSWCEAKQKCLRGWEENCGSADLDQAFNLLNNLRLQAQGWGLSPDYVQDSSFGWLVSNKSRELAAKRLLMAGGTGDDLTKVEQYLKDSGLVSNQDNVKDEASGGQRGYSSSELVCLVSFKLAGLTETLPVTANFQSLAIDCAPRP